MRCSGPLVEKRKCNQAMLNVSKTDPGGPRADESSPAQSFVPFPILLIVMLHLHKPSFCGRRHMQLIPSPCQSSQKHQSLDREGRMSRLCSPKTAGPLNLAKACQEALMVIQMHVRTEAGTVGFHFELSSPYVMCVAYQEVYSDTTLDPNNLMFIFIFGSAPATHSRQRD